MSPDEAGSDRRPFERSVDVESTFQLIERARAGDHEALECLFARHLKPLQRWARGRLPKWARDLADTDDLVQDTLVQTFKKIDDFEPRRVGALQAYLRQAVLNRIRNELRRKGRQPHRTDLEGIEVDAAQSPLEQAIQVQVKISPGERSRLELTRAVDADVYEKYLRGVFLLNKETLASTTEAVRLLETAVERDSTFAPSHAALALAYNTMGTIFIGGSAPSQTQPKAIASARKVLELDPDLPDGHAVMAYVLQRQWRWAEAEAGYRRAIELDPNDSQAHYGLANLLTCLGRFDEAVAIGRRARDLDPLSSWGRDYGSLLYLARRYDEAIRELRTLASLESGNSWTLWYLGYALLGSSRFDEAIDVLERSVLRERNAGPLGTLSLAYGRAGRFADAKRILNELTKASQINYVPPSALVEAYIGLGDFDRAFLWLERAYAEHSNSLRILKIDPVLDPVRGDPRLADLLGRVNLG